jgi:hypothetical protein
MPPEYIFSDKGRKILELSHVDERFADATKREISFAGLFSCTYDSDLKVILRDFKTDEFYSKIDTEERDALHDTLRSRIRSPGLWQATKSGVVYKKDATLNDLAMLAGLHASFIMRPDDVPRYKEFGSSSLAEFFGIIGAYIREKTKSTFYKSLPWTFESDGKIWLNEIEGDTNLDLNLRRTDIQFYDTMNPLGEPINYKPIFSEDWGHADGYQYGEVPVLGTILKYAHHTNIESKLLRDNAKGLLEWTSEQLCKKIDESSEPHTTVEITSSLAAFNLAPVRLDEHNHIMPGASMNAGRAEAAISSKNELAIGHSNFKESSFSVSIAYNPAEIDDLLKGLFYHTMFGSSRTDITELIDMVRIRFSKDFDKKYSPGLPLN